MRCCSEEVWKMKITRSRAVVVEIDKNVRKRHFCFKYPLQKLRKCKKLEKLQDWRLYEIHGEWLKL